MQPFTGIVILNAGARRRLCVAGTLLLSAPIYTSSFLHFLIRLGGTATVGMLV